MASVIAVGSAVVDFTMRVDGCLPLGAQKYRAVDAAILGGGCAATAAVAVSRLGGEAHLAGRLGQDAIGATIRAGLEAEGVGCALLRAFPGARSSFSTVVVDAAGERQIINFRDDAMPADARWLADEALPAFGAALADTRWPEGAAALMARARAAGLPGIIDAEAPVRDAVAALRAASHIAFSAPGLADFTGLADRVAALRQAAAETGAWACVTDGAAGVWWLEQDTPRHAAAFRVATVDTLGAGDVWHGAFALALAEGATEPVAIRFASAAAAIKCSRPGGRDGAPTRAEVENFLKEHE